MAAVMRLGVDETGVTELLAVAEHASALSTVAAALGLQGLADEGALVAPVDPAAAGPHARPVLDEVAAWAAAALGAEGVPVLWRVLARRPHHLEASWRKERVVMADGALPARDKRRVALGVAMNARGRYMVEYHAAVLRRAGDVDEDLLEVLGVVDHFVSLNTLADAMQIDSDIRPPA